MSDLKFLVLHLLTEGFFPWSCRINFHYILFTGDICTIS